MSVEFCFAVCKMAVSMIDSRKYYVESNKVFFCLEVHKGCSMIPLLKEILEICFTERIYAVCVKQSTVGINLLLCWST